MGVNSYHEVTKLQGFGVPIRIIFSRLQHVQGSHYGLDCRERRPRKHLTWFLQAKTNFFQNHIRINLVCRCTMF